MKITCLGDSIRIQYAPRVRELLGEDFDIYAPNENCRYAKYTLHGLYDWGKHMKDSRIVHWNNGLWDTCEWFEDGCFSTADEYVANMLRIADLLLARHEIVIFATTTPTSVKNERNKAERVKQYNELLVPKLIERGVIINDLYAIVAADPERLVSDDNIHLSSEGIELCANAVANAIRKAAETLDAAKQKQTDETEKDTSGLAVSFEENITPKKAIRIGCIGDSITAGTGLANAQEEAFPARLGELLKYATVFNFGNGGKTMRGDLGVDSYVNCQTYQNLLNEANNLDLVTIMLGTNDAYHANGWTEEEKATFKADCQSLVATLHKKNPAMQFLLMNSPACFGEKSFRYNMPPLRLLQTELVTELNALGYKTHFFDMYSLTKPLGDEFPDQLHPNKAAHLVMAQALCEKINKLLHEVTL